MLWLDSTYPVDSTALGAARGTCATTSGVPADVEADSPNASVIYSNIRFGPLNSTFSASSAVSGGSGTSSSATSTPTGTTSTTAAAHWAQCGGIGWTGATTCASGYTCTELNAYYSQCL